MKGKGITKLCAAVLVIALTVYIAIAGIGAGKLGSIHNVKLGLDLAGGVSITYETVKEDPTDTEMSDTVYKMQRRAENFSTESEVYPEGDKRITVAIPDVTDADAVLAELGDAGNIYFIYGIGPSGETNIERTYNSETNDYDYKLLRSIEEMTASGDVVIDGSDIASAEPNMYQNQIGATENIVSLTLNSVGASKFADATQYAAQYYSASAVIPDLHNVIAIVYDGKVVNAPRVTERISGGQASISGQSSYEESKLLASTIRIGALPLELKVLRYNVVGAQLGAEAIDTSLLAGLIGFIIIILFMIFMYRIPGAAASIALVFYVGLMVICLNIFGVTLTLPGVAGIILSVGMAVDANVIIFTRIQEEIGLGKTVRSSIKSGFSKALSAIIDGNVTTILAAVVLYFLGSGTVKGFAQTLAIGIILSMITALFVTKFILNAFYELGADDVKLYGSKTTKKVTPFVENFKKFIAVSGGLILVGIIAIVINLASTGDAFNYGLDFKGGTATTVTFNEELPSDIQSQLETLVSNTVGKTPEISIVWSDKMVTIKTAELTPDERAAIEDKLVSTYNVDERLIETTSVGSTVSDEMRRDAVVAVIVATIGMLLYIWIRFSNITFAASSVLCLVHDVLVVLMVYAVGRAFISVGNTFIACMLTIVGYSINATIVVFDRIRENMKEKLKKDSLADVVNLSVTQTFSRSINTSLTTLLMVLMLAILGVSSVREFAIPLIAGIICGGFSSICIAGGLWYTFQTKFGKAE